MRRVRALQKLGRDTVLATELPCTETEALVLAHRLAPGWMPSALEEGWLVRELIETHGLNQATLGMLLGHTKSLVSRRLGLVRVLPASVQDSVRRGAIPAHAATKYLLPLARANRSHCERLVKAVAAERPSTRQVGVLYQGVARRRRGAT